MTDFVKIQGSTDLEDSSPEGDEPTQEYQCCNEPGRASVPPPPSREQPSSSEWYVRLRLREDRVARLWVRQLVSRDILVWWEQQRTWAPLLSVPQLRQAVAVVQQTVTEPPRPDREAARKTHPQLEHELPVDPALLVPSDSETHSQAFPSTNDADVVGAADASRAIPSGTKSVSSERPPPPQALTSNRPEVGPQRVAWIEQWRERVAAESRMSPAVRAMVSGARRSSEALHLSSRQTIPPPPSSVPPMIVDNIPAAPALPNLEPEPPTVPRVTPPPREPASSEEHVRHGLGTTERMLWLAAATVLACLLVLSRLPKNDSPTALATQAPQDLAARASEVFFSQSMNPPRPASEPKKQAPPSPSGTAESTAAESTAAESTAEKSPKKQFSKSHSRSANLARRSSGSRPQSAPASQPAPAPSVTLGASMNAAGSVPPDETTENKVKSPKNSEQPKPAADLGGFDAAAARRALMSAAQRVGYCGEGPVSGSVVITFAPSGFVTGVSLTSVQGENVRTDCVRRSFQAVRVSPYQGKPVTVSKSF